MENEENQQEIAVNGMHKRCETMPDGRRYIIYYTFGNDETDPQNEVTENV